MEDSKKTIRQLTRRLQKERKEFDFFELVRQLEQTHREMPRVGTAHFVKDEPVRFGQVPYLHFPDRVIGDVSDKGSYYLIFVYFMGLLGVNGPMPLEFTSYVFQRSYNSYDHTLRRFLDIVNHKFISFFFRAWELNELPASFDRHDDDSVTEMIQALAGEQKTTHRGMLPEYTGAFWNGLFGMVVKSRSGLEILLREYFRLPLSVLDFQLSQGDIPRSCRCRLGAPEVSTLGINAQLGSRFYSLSKKFMIEIGPVDYFRCEHLLPGARGFDELVELVHRYLDRLLEFDVRFILRSGTIPRTLLGRRGAIGRNSWLSSNPPDAGLTVLSIGASRLAAAQHLKKLQSHTHKEN